MFMQSHIYNTTNQFSQLCPNSMRSLWALPNPQAARFSSRAAMRNSSQLRWRARYLGASLHALPPSSAPRARALAFRAASSSSQWRGRRTMAQHTSERAAPSQPGLDGDDNLVIGSVLKDRHHELDAGSDDGRSIDLPSMPPSSLRNAMHVVLRPAARSRSSAPSASCVPLLAAGRQEKPGVRATGAPGAHAV